MALTREAAGKGKAALEKILAKSKKRGQALLNQIGEAGTRPCAPPGIIIRSGASQPDWPGPISRIGSRP